MFSHNKVRKKEAKVDGEDDEDGGADVFSFFPVLSFVRDFLDLGESSVPSDAGLRFRGGLGTGATTPSFPVCAFSASGAETVNASTEIPASACARSVSRSRSSWSTSMRTLAYSA